jgi:hypothetical protein
VNIPLQPILFSIPALIYLVLLKRRGDNWKAAFRKIGWRGSRPVDYLWGMGICILIGGLGWLRHRSESILPGWLAHSLINALGALSIME